MNFLKDIPAKYVLLIIIAIALILRIINLTIGFPMLYLSNDEAVFHLSALNMIANKTVFSLGNYGPLGSYLQLPFLVLAYLILLVTGKVNSIADMEIMLAAQEGYFMFIPRIISALFGTLTILSVYLLSKEIYNDKRAALWSGFFVAVSFSLVHISHLARGWAGGLFFMTLAALYAIKSVNDKRNEFKHNLFSVFFAAIAFGFHQITGVVIILIFLIKGIAKSSFVNLISKKNLTVVSLWLFLIFLFNYLSVGNKIFELLGSSNSAYLIKPSLLEANFALIFKNAVSSLKILWHLVLAEGIITLLAIIGLAKSNKNLLIPFSSFLILNLFLTLFVFPNILRYLLPSIIFLPIFAGKVLSDYFAHKKNLFVLSIIIIASSFNSFYWNYLITRPTTFTQMRQWLDENIRPEIPVAATSYRGIGYVPSAPASNIIRQFRPGYYQKAAMLIGNAYPYNVRNILYLEAFNRSSKLDNLKAGLSVFPADYIIDAYYKDSDRLFYMTDNLKIIAHFTPTDGKISKDRIPEAFFDSAHNFPFFVLDRTGSYFDILKIER